MMSEFLIRPFIIAFSLEISAKKIALIRPSSAFKKRRSYSGKTPISSDVSSEAFTSS